MSRPTGTPQPESARKAISEASRERWADPAYKAATSAAMSKALRGRVLTDEWIVRIRASHRTPEYRAKMSAIRKSGARYASKLDSHLRRKYGIGEVEYRDMMEKQNGLCRICEKGPRKPNMRLDVDHSRTTGKVRGLLCGPCNMAIGLLQHDAALLEKAINYLGRSR